MLSKIRSRTYSRIGEGTLLSSSPSRSIFLERMEGLRTASSHDSGASVGLPLASIGHSGRDESDSSDDDCPPTAAGGYSHPHGAGSGFFRDHPSANNQQQHTSVAHDDCNNGAATPHQSLSGADGDHDVRDELFEAIPEPYPHPTDFQRVIITLSGEPPDRDTVEACRNLKQCILLREKWLSGHPMPPQDCIVANKNGEDNSPASAAMGGASPNPETPFFKKRSSSFELRPAGEFRRRQPPEYDVFSRPLPPTCSLYTYTMVGGVVRVHHNKLKAPTYQQLAVNKEHVFNGEEKEQQPNAAAAQIVSDNLQALALDEATLPISAAVGSSGYEEESLGLVTDGDSVDNGMSDGNDFSGGDSVFSVGSFEEFVNDFNTVRQAVHSGPTSSFSFRQLELLAAKFHLHELLNGYRENEAQKSVPHRDFYNVRKVDTHVHHSACMNQKHLLRFIKHKLRHVPNEVVVFRDGKFLTLGEVFKSLRLTAYDLSIDTLDMHANDTFHRFDRFNLKYNPAGQSRLREIFLKTDNVIGGRYLAEVTKEVITDLEAGKYQLVEWRVSIYGRKASEWDSLAKWFYTNRLAHNNVRWLIQIPRLFHIYRKGGELRSFGQMLNNIFGPLFAVTLDPSSNPALHYFLETIVGIDSVDDESRPEHGQLAYGVGDIPLPDEWTSPNNPPYGYWMYFMYANLCVLNKLRASLGMCTFQFRPHCGEAGDVDHLVSCYLVANQINHGIQLRKNAALQYLYYLSQVGIAMSPLSNNKLFLDYAKNPFPKYFYMGMNVSLSTDDPLMLHYTKDALVEEYSVAAQVWKLDSVDMCEIARNSVLQSGWEMRFKQFFLGADLDDIKETNVPAIRLRYRKETLDAEIATINAHVAES